MSALATALASPAHAAHPKLDPAGQAAMAGIMKILEDANKPKPEAVAKLVDDRLAAILPAFKAAVEAVGSTETGKIQSAAARLLQAIQATEQGLGERIERLTAETLQRLAPRTVQVVGPNNVQLGRVEGYVRPEFEEVLQTVDMGLNVMLVGPAGCGKSTFAKQIADALSLPFHFQSFSAGVTESYIVGRFAPVGEQGQFRYLPTPFVQAFKHGGVYLADELDAADPNVLLCMNAALANRRLATPNPEEPAVEMHPDFRFIAACNTWGTGGDREYVGRAQLDASTLDRCAGATFELDYDEEYERRVGEPQVVAYFQNVRRAARERKIRRVVSTRIILNGSTRVRGGHGLAQVIRSFFLPGTDGEKRQVGYSE